jgi:hypothetical protein
MHPKLINGYFWAMLTRTKRPVSRELIELQYRGQMRRLRAFFKTRIAQRKSWFGASK